MRHIHRPLSFLLTLIPSVLLGTTIPGGTSEISEVTVYLNGAEIVRETQVEIPRGLSTIEFADFPGDIRAPSIRASLEGVPAIVRSIEMADTDEAGKNTQTPLDRKITELEDQLFALDLTRTDDKALRDYLKAAANSGANNEDTGADAAAITAVYDLLESRFEGLQKDRLSQRKLRRDLERQLAEAKEAKKKEQDGVPPRTARFAVEAQASGQATLIVRYFVWEAAWEPNYGGTLSDDGSLELVAEAAVRQWTHEDWSDVRLKLSTVAASRTLSAPHLGPWRIRPWQRRANRAMALQEPSTAGADQRGQQSNFVAVPEVDEIQMEMPASMDLATTSTETRYSVTFEVPGRVRVEGGGPPQQFIIWEETLASTVAYRIKPSLEAAAYLEATVRAPTAVPLLAGELALYTGNTLIGAHELPETGPGETRIIPFGNDPRIKVERVTRDVSEGRQGAIRKQAREERAYSTKITNHRDEAVRVVVEDRLPVADDERIVVTLSDETTPGHKPSSNRRGVVLWQLDLAAGETGEIDFGYSVRYPLDMTIEGMDKDS